MTQEFDDLLLAMGIGVAGGFVFLVFKILWHLRKKKPFFPKGKKLKSPNMLYAGIVFFASFAMFSFFTSTPFFAIVFLLLMLIYIWCLIVYKRKGTNVDAKNKGNNLNSLNIKKAKE